MDVDVLDLPSPIPAARRDSLRHIKISISKPWLAGALTSAVIATGSWLYSTAPLMWSWEKHQITDVQLGRVLYESAPTPGAKAEVPQAFDERLLPDNGIYPRFTALETALAKSVEAAKVQSAEIATLRALLVDQYRWRVRWQAADAERDPRKRMDTANRAEAKFKRLVGEGKSVDEAFREALSINPYDLR